MGGVLTNFHGSERVAGQTSFELEMRGFYFGPTVLRGTPGQALALVLHNRGDTLHSFTLQEQGISQDVIADRSQTVQVTFPQSGTLRFVCRYHESLGMAGGLEAVSQ